MSLIKRFATEDYVATALDEKLLFHSTASVGQTIVVKAIDENGKPTEWECIDSFDPTFVITVDSDNIADKTRQEVFEASQ